MKKTPKERQLSYEYLSECLHYDPICGVFKWKERPLGHFATKRACSVWNSRFKNTSPGCIDAEGYSTFAVSGILLKAHRVAWILITKNWPEHDIDHINGIRHDNSFCNLRAVSRKENSQNQKKRQTNTSGCMGVTRRGSAEKWRVRISFNGKDIHIGDYGSLEEAVTARKQAEITYGYHENHGR